LTRARPKALISWSSGKDSAFSLHEIRGAGDYDVVGALTTVTESFDRVSIHGVRQEILQAQLEAAGLPPRIVPIPYPCPNAIYEARMGEAVARAVREGITHIIFGDLSAIAGRSARRRRSLRRERRVSYLRSGGADLFAPISVAPGKRVERDGYGYCDPVMDSGPS
jgi:diphthamide synthase (EF-2-diphthine--ammonia ligase)